jgi:hypothetical protein
VKGKDGIEGEGYRKEPGWEKQNFSQKKMKI